MFLMAQGIVSVGTQLSRLCDGRLTGQAIPVLVLSFILALIAAISVYELLVPTQKDSAKGGGGRC